MLIFTRNQSGKNKYTCLYLTTYSYSQQRKTHQNICHFSLTSKNIYIMEFSSISEIRKYVVDRVQHCSDTTKLYSGQNERYKNVSQAVEIQLRLSSFIVFIVFVVVAVQGSGALAPGQTTLARGQLSRDTPHST